MITREADYAVRTVLGLAQQTDGAAWVPLRTLSETMQIPYRFLRKLVGSLTRGGVLESHRGRTGGVRLAREAAHISLLEVLRTVDAQAMRFNTCLVSRSACGRHGICPVHDELLALQADVDRRLSALTFARLARPRRRGGAGAPPRRTTAPAG